MVQSPEALRLRRTATCEAHHRVGAQDQRLVSTTHTFLVLFFVLIKKNIFSSSFPHLFVFLPALQPVWEHPGGGGEGCRQREEPAAAARAAVQLHAGRVLPALHQRGAGSRSDMLSVSPGGNMWEPRLSR